MIYIYEAVEYNGDFGSVGTVSFFEDVAIRLNLTALLRFLIEGKLKILEV
jgi:hypothetical protein